MCKHIGPNLFSLNQTCRFNSNTGHTLSTHRSHTEDSQITNWTLTDHTLITDWTLNYDNAHMLITHWSHIGMLIHWSHTELSLITYGVLTDHILSTHWSHTGLSLITHSPFTDHTFECCLIHWLSHTELSLITHRALEHKSHLIYCTLITQWAQRNLRRKTIEEKLVSKPATCQN